MRPTLVVILAPSFDHLLCLTKRFEPVQIQAFLVNRSVEGFDKCAVGPSPWSAEVEVDLVVRGPKVQQTTSEFAAVVGEDAVRVKLVVA